MRHADYHTLINRGRKAGLNTADLYHAIATLPPEAASRQTGQADENGFVSMYNGQGQRVFCPAGASRRS